MTNRYKVRIILFWWSAQGTGSVTISESVPVKKGCEYTMSLTWSVAGQWQRSVFTKGTCPG